MRSYLHVGVIVLFSIVTTVFSQESEYVCDTTYEKEIVYDTTITPRDVNYFKIPVTYYDYHVDGSNPDFGYRVTSRWDQAGLEYANIGGWVDSTLSEETGLPQRHPALTDTFLDISWNIGQLFTPWEEGTVDSFTLKFPPIIQDTIISDTLVVTVDTNYTVKTVYEIDTSYGEDSTMIFDTLSSRLDSTMNILVDSATSIVLYDTIQVPDTILTSDTMFKCIVIEDSMAAYWVPFEFTYEDTTDSMWVFGKREKMDPINGLGFGNESDSTQNAGYALHIKNQFTYKGGEKLYFGADDDAYVFINGKMAIDCGGFHEAIIDSLYLDSMLLEDSSHLTVDEKYDIDVFMIERRMGGNIYLAGLSEFELKGAVNVETFYDTSIAYHFDTTLVKIMCTGVDPRGRNLRQQKRLFGMNIPAAAEQVNLEYFTVSGARVLNRNVSLATALTDNNVNLPCGMYIIRINFYNKNGKALSKPRFHRMVVK